MSLPRRAVRSPFRRPAAVDRATCARPTAALRHACIITTSRGSARADARPARAEPPPTPGLSATLATLPASAPCLRPAFRRKRLHAAAPARHRSPPRPTCIRRKRLRTPGRGASLVRSRAARPRPAPAPFAGTRRPLPSQSPFPPGRTCPLLNLRLSEPLSSPRTPHKAPRPHPRPHSQATRRQGIARRLFAGAQPAPRRLPGDP